MKSESKEPVGFVAFQLFRSLLLHFNPKVKYNAVGYHFKTSVSVDKFKQSKFRWSYAKLEHDSNNNQLELLAKYLCVFEAAKFKHLSEKALFTRLHKLKPSIELILTKLKTDLHFIKQLYNTLDNAINADGPLYPELYNQYLLKNISLFSLLIIDAFMTPDCAGILNKERSRDVLNWTSFIEESQLIKPLLLVALDDSVVYEIFREVFPELKDN